MRNTILILIIVVLIALGFLSYKIEEASPVLDETQYADSSKEQNKGRTVKNVLQNLECRDSECDKG